MGSQSKARCRLEAYLPMMILERLGLLTQFSNNWSRPRLVDI